MYRPGQPTGHPTGHRVVVGTHLSQLGSGVIFLPASGGSIEAQCLVLFNTPLSLPFPDSYFNAMKMIIYSCRGFSYAEILTRLPR